MSILDEHSGLENALAHGPPVRSQRGQREPLTLGDGRYVFHLGFLDGLRDAGERHGRARVPRGYCRLVCERGEPLEGLPHVLHEAQLGPVGVGPRRRESVHEFPKDLVGQRCAAVNDVEVALRACGWNRIRPSYIQVRMEESANLSSRRASRHLVH